MSEIVQVNFRMPKELKDRLEASAQESGRSITAELVMRLERSFEHLDYNANNDFDVFMSNFTNLVEKVPDEDPSSNILKIMSNAWKEQKKKPTT